MAAINDHSLRNPDTAYQQYTDQSSPHGAQSETLLEKQKSPTAYHSPVDGSGDFPRPLHRTDTQRHWQKSKQRARMLVTLSSRLVINFVLCAVTAGVLVAYEHKYIIQDSGKYLFNALVTGLSIGIGLNFAAGLSQVARHARWWFISRKPLHPQDFENAYDCESQTSVLKLLFSSFSGWKTRLACALWIAFFIVSSPETDVRFIYLLWL